MPADCDACQRSEANFAAVYQYLWTKYPDRRFALLSTEADATTRFFFGFGYQHASCEQEDEMPADVFRSGLAGLRSLADAQQASNFTTFVSGGDQHTLLLQSLDEVTADGIMLAEWLTELITAEAIPPHAGAL